MLRIDPARLIDAREAEGWSQAELAARAGLTRQAVWLIEHGGSAGSFRSIDALSRALGVREIDLLVSDRDNDPFATSSM